MKKYAIILAAGKGTRMKSKTHKCATNFLGKPIIKQIVEKCKSCKFDEIIVVVGDNKEIIENILHDEVTYIYQKQQLGTAHAVLCCESYFNDKAEGLCVIFPGDIPLVDKFVINNLLKSHEITNHPLTIVSTNLKTKNTYGRIIRTPMEGSIIKIKEFKDSSNEEKQIEEINSGLYCIKTNMLFKYLKQINNNNCAKEYYLTDLVELMSKDYIVGCLYVEEWYKLMGVNTLEELSELELIYEKIK